MNRSIAVCNLMRPTARWTVPMAVRCLRREILSLKMKRALMHGLSERLPWLETVKSSAKDRCQMSECIPEECLAINRHLKNCCLERDACCCVVLCENVLIPACLSCLFRLWTGTRLPSLSGGDLTSRASSVGCSKQPRAHFPTAIYLSRRFSVAA